VTLELALLVVSKYRQAVGLVTSMFFVAIYPGNISQWINGTSGFGLDTDQARLIRLFFQPALVLWTIWCTKAR
jgi:uncharacterized membrane protein